MNQTTLLPLTLFNGNDTAVGVTHQACEFQIVKGLAKVLELEDVLFHHNSAVMMPDNPKDSSGSTASSEQNKVSGVRALALVFRQYQMQPDKKLLIAGHADRSGEAKVNFSISALRAQNVQFLLQGMRSEWADICVQKHKIEDYQQILLYFSKRMNWNCNPGNVNDQWGKDTKNAVANFITLYNFSFSWKPSDAQLEESLLDVIEKNNEKKWPQEMWEAVFDLYEHDLVLAATGDNIPGDAFNALRGSLQFVDATKPCVACGESFPISQDNKQNYRSQKDRRVEILFFDNDELPLLNCPNRDSSVHTEDECPVYNKLFYKFEYISPESFFTSTYHLKFVFYNRINKELTPLPDGLIIKAWKEGTTELETITKYDNGLYELTVKGITNTPREQNIHLTFETTDSWIYTADDESVVVKKMTLDDFKRLSLSEKMHYYDLPVKWDSRNWFCEIGGSEGVFEKKNVEVTTPANPMIFYLDDCILFENKAPNNVPITWNKKNRFTLFDRALSIVDPDPDKPYWSAMQTEQNYIYTGNTPADYRAIALKGDFYDLTIGRSYQGSVIGARIALKNDIRVHVFGHLREPITSGAGHFDIHYFHECFDDKSEACGVALVYWSCKLTIGSGTVADIPELENFRKTGMLESKKRWEKKGYVFVPKVDPDNLNLKVNLRFFFEDNPQITPPNCVVNIQDPSSPAYRSSMGLDSADFSKDTFEENTGGSSAVEDTKKYYWYTMAHELGHGCGLDDEYIEPIEEDSEFVWDPVLPRFQQWYDGMPYSLDPNSMMVGNQAPRLRHVWHHCKWINENAKKLTGNSVFQIHHEGLHKLIPYSFDYFLERKYDNFYKAAYQEINKKNNTDGIFDLLLYQVGNDELTICQYAELINSESYFDAILVIRINIHWYFKNFSGNSDSQWLVNLSTTPKVHEKLTFLQNFQNSVNKNLVNSFWVEYSSDDRKDLKKIYLYFLPHHLLENGSGDSSKSHFTVNVHAEDPVTGSEHSNTLSGNAITIGKDFNNITLIRYMLGLTTSTTTLSGGINWITDISSTDLNFVAQWVKSQSTATHEYMVNP